MLNCRTHLEKLRRDAVECELLRDTAIDPNKRELFARLALHLTVLAGEVERAIVAESATGTGLKLRHKVPKLEQILIALRKAGS